MPRECNYAADELLGSTKVDSLPCKLDVASLSAFRCSVICHRLLPPSFLNIYLRTYLSASIDV